MPQSKRLETYRLPACRTQLGDMGLRTDGRKHMTQPDDIQYEKDNTFWIVVVSMIIGFLFGIGWIKT